jgi:ABC-type uncharacterized transport system ATPase component
MRLRHDSEYLSITPFASVDLTPFTLLTGSNGAGKTHLLQAIKNGRVCIEGVSPERIVFFDHSQFVLDDESQVSSKSLQEERKEIYDAIREQLTSRNFIALIREIVEVLGAIAYKKGMGFYDLSAEDLHKEGMAEFFPAYQQYTTQVLELIDRLSEETPASINRHALQRLCREIKKPLELLSREELDQWYTPRAYKNEFLIHQLGKVFSDYWEKWELNLYRRFRNEKFQEAHFTYSEEEFIEEFGEKPWVVVNRIIARFGSLHYQVNSPEGLERGHDYQVKLVSTREEKVAVDFSQLSSGERTLMALVSGMYKAIVDRQFPQLLLLDEIDAFLHPGMVRNMLDVLVGEFVQNKGLNVILTTHAPSTVAQAPEGSVFIMHKGGVNRIVPTSKKGALSLLTDGFASLTTSESHLKVSYNVNKASDCILFTEGITEKIILEAAWYNLESRELSFDILDCFDAGFLGNLFARGGLFDNYPHKTFVAVFDFDEEGYTAWNALPGYHLVEADPRKGLLKKHAIHPAYALLLPVPEGVVQLQGIEGEQDAYGYKPHLPMELLFYGVPALSNRFVREPMAGGGTLIRFQGDKTSFASEVATRLAPDDFEPLRPLFEVVKDIFSSEASVPVTKMRAV